MKAITYALRSFLRELRSGEVLVLLAAIVLAVAALTAVGFLTDRIGKAVERQANEVLAADLRLRSQEPIPEAWRGQARDFGLRTVDKFRIYHSARSESNRRLTAIGLIIEKGSIALVGKPFLHGFPFFFSGYLLTWVHSYSPHNWYSNLTWTIIRHPLRSRYCSAQIFTK